MPLRHEKSRHTGKFLYDVLIVETTMQLVPGPFRVKQERSISNIFIQQVMLMHMLYSGLVSLCETSDSPEWPLWPPGGPEAHQGG